MHNFQLILYHFFGRNSVSILYCNINEQWMQETDNLISPLWANIASPHKIAENLRNLIKLFSIYIEIYTEFYYSTRSVIQHLYIWKPEYKIINKILFHFKYTKLKMYFMSSIGYSIQKHTHLWCNLWSSAMDFCFMMRMKMTLKALFTRKLLVLLN